jgi:ubiquinone/menaquinone biosynthesis C-methylase UbiE
VTAKPDFPYFDMLLEARASAPSAFRVFERHVHCGYWPSPGAATGTNEDLMGAMQRLDDEILAAADLGDGMRVLDVGCGFGGTLASVCRRHRDMTLIGVNIDERQLAVARGSRSRSGNGTEFITADACHLPFRDASFDRVTAVECIFHFAARETFLREAARVLRAGGSLVISDFVPRSMDPRMLLIGRGIHRMMEQAYGRQSAEWPRDGYRTIADATGLELYLDRDITANTLPTYAAMRDVTRRSLRFTRLLRWVITTTELLSRLGLVQYRILGFRKPGPPARILAHGSERLTDFAGIDRPIL